MAAARAKDVTARSDGDRTAAMRSEQATLSLRTGRMRRSGK